jgi:hypothetical protein
VDKGNEERMAGVKNDDVDVDEREREEGWE